MFAKRVEDGAGAERVKIYDVYVEKVHNDELPRSAEGVEGW